MKLLLPFTICLVSMFGCQSHPNEISVDIQWVSHREVCVAIDNSGSGPIIIHQSSAGSDWQPGLYIYVFPEAPGHSPVGDHVPIDDIWNPGYLLSDIGGGHRVSLEPGERLTYRIEVLSLLRGIRIDPTEPKPDAYGIQVLYLPWRGMDIETDECYTSSPQYVNQGVIFDTIERAVIEESGKGDGPLFSVPGNRVIPPNQEKK